MTETPRAPSAKTQTKLTVRAITPRDWPAIQDLFGDNGACGGCWCMFWRVPPGRDYWQAHKGTKNRSSFRRLVRSGKAKGCLAFSDKQPVGWISIGPKPDFSYLARSPKLRGDFSPGIWSVTCFFIKSGWRGKGVATALVKAAVDFARTNKAAAVEGYPSAPPASGKMAASFAWTGVPGVFTAAGFEPIEQSQRGRSLYRKSLKKEPRRRAGGVPNSRADEVGRRS